MTQEAQITSAPPAEVTALIEERTTLRKWLSGLESQRGVASDRILERVRADYEKRLAATDAALSAHVESVRTELESATSRAAAAESAHDGALDALEEARLRRTIGEIPDAGWPEREAELLAEVQRTSATEEAARADVERLTELVATLTATREPSGWETVSAGLGVDADLTVEEGSAPAAAAATEEEGSGDFLAEIDEVMAEDSGGAMGGDAANLPADPDGIPGPETAPQPGLKCGECGYTNELSAWFCAVCGADVG